MSCSYRFSGTSVPGGLSRGRWEGSSVSLFHSGPSKTYSISSRTGWTTFNITALAQHFSGRVMHVRIESLSAGCHSEFASSAAEQSHHPYLSMKGQCNDECAEFLGCPPGSFSIDPEASGSSDCMLCAAGTYSGWTGAFTCTSCPVGEYSSSPGASLCASCPVDA